MIYFLIWCYGKALWPFLYFVTFIKCASPVCGNTARLFYVLGFNEVRRKDNRLKGRKLVDEAIININFTRTVQQCLWDPKQ